MAAGRIEGHDIISGSVDQAFGRLQQLLEKQLVLIEKLRLANVKLNNQRAKGANTASQMRTVLNLNEKLIASERVLTVEKEKGALATKKGSAATLGYAAATVKASVATRLFGGAIKTLSMILSTFLGPLAIFYALWQGIGKLKNTLIQLDSFKFALEKLTGSSVKATETMRWLIDMTERFGVNLGVAADRYVKFSASAQQAGLRLEETRQIFSDMSKASGVLGLKAHEVEGVFLALEQMLSKGKVTTEELRRQLGERLPGAFGIMAATVNKLNPNIEVTVQTLDKMLKSGSVLSHEVLPEFAKMYNEAFGIDKVERVDTLAASQARFKNSWTAFVFEMEEGSSIMSTAFKGFFDGLAIGFNAAADKLTLLGSDYLTTMQKIQVATIGFFGVNEALMAESIRDQNLTYAAWSELKDRLLVIKGVEKDLGKAESRAEWDRKARLQSINVVLESGLRTEKEKLAMLLLIGDALDDNLAKQLEGPQEPEAETISFFTTQISELTEKINIKATLQNYDSQEIQDLATSISLYKEKKKQLMELLGLVKAPKVESDKTAEKEAKARLEIVSQINQQILDSAMNEMAADETSAERKMELENQVYLHRQRLAAAKADQSKVGLEKETAQWLAADEKLKTKLLQLQYQHELNVAKIKENSFSTNNILAEASLTQAFNQQKAEVHKLYAEGKISKEKYDQDLFDLEVAYQTRVLELKIEAFKAEIIMMKGRGEDTTKMLNALIALEEQLQKIRVKGAHDGPSTLSPEDAAAKKAAELQSLFNDIKEWTDALTDIGNSMFDTQLENIGAEMQAVEDKYARAYELADGDREQQKAINIQKRSELKKLEKEELKIKQRQAIFNKVQAIANVGMNTAVAITRVAYDPFRVALVAALGALQLGAVVATPIPKYAKGRDGGKEELAIVGDGGRQEVITSGDKAWLTPNKPTLAHLDKDASVYPSKQAFKDQVYNSIIGQVNTHYELEQIEKAIERGFKKATINNYMKLPRDSSSDVAEQLWLIKNSQF